MSRFNQRSSEKEKIDDLNLTGADLEQNLRELAIINTYLGGNQVTISGITKLLKNYKNKDSALTIADLGSGGGDMIFTLNKWFKRKNINHKLIGLDANQFMIDYSTKKIPENSTISFEMMNIFSEDFKQKNFDIATMTLFCHHFSNEELIELIQILNKTTKIGIVINDIHRHWMAYYSIRWITYLFSKSYLVKHDAQLSVLRAFTKKEIIQIIQKAGIQNYSIKWKWAFRWEIVLFKN